LQIAIQNHFFKNRFPAREDLSVGVVREGVRWVYEGEDKMKAEIK